MSDPIKKGEPHHTYGEYCGWPEDQRWELIDGVAYDMSPAPSRKHQALSMEVSRQISNFLKGNPRRVYHAPFDVRLPAFFNQEDGEIDTVVQPDIVVVCNREKLDERGCRGAPDWVIEILSPHTLQKDLKVKSVLYGKHGVRELWFLHPIDRSVMVFVLGPGGGYGRPRFYGPEDRVESSAVPGLTIDMKTAFEEAER